MHVQKIVKSLNNLSLKKSLLELKFCKFASNNIYTNYEKNLLLLLSLITINLTAQDCDDLFISEYVEGPGNNNLIEIYNPTNNEINLDGYTINRYGNGSQTPSETATKWLPYHQETQYQ